MTNSNSSRRRFLKLSTLGAVVVVVAGVGAYLALQPQPSPAPAATPRPAQTPVATPSPTAPPAGISPQPSPSVVAPSSQPTLTPTLLDKARQEGKVVIYSTFGIETLELIKKAFEKKYPQIAVENVRGGPEIVSRYLAEYRAGKHIVDVHLTSNTYLLPALDEGLITPYLSPEMAAFPPELRDPENRWCSVQQSPQVIAYNTDRVKRGDIPTNYWDLLKPRFKDTLGILDPRTRPHSLYITKRKIIGENRWMEWLRGLLAQNPKIAPAYGEFLQLIRSGEVSVGLWSYTSTLIANMREVAPMDFVRKPNTMLSDLSMVSIYKYATHPNAARLLFDYLISVEGQQLIVDTAYYVVTRPGVTQKMGLGVGTGEPVLPEYVAFEPISSLKQYDDATAEWNKVFTR